MKKRILVICSLVLASMILVACSPTEGPSERQDAALATPTPPPPRPPATPTPDPTPEIPTLPPEAPEDGHGEYSLVGNWDWMGIPYFTFHADGTGVRGIGLSFNWTTEGDLLLICGTPDECHGNCPAPEEWFFEIFGEHLLLESAHAIELVFDLTAGTTTIEAAIPAVFDGSSTASHDLVGEWNWQGTLYYVFNADGTGIRGGYILNLTINRTTEDGVLIICDTPDECGNTCIAPERWNYSISGNEMVLDNTHIPGMSFTYTRR